MRFGPSFARILGMSKVYELMVLVKPDTEIAIEKLVGSKVAVEKTENLGKKTLAYPIAKCKEAIYWLYQLKGDNLSAAQIQKQVSLNEQVLRFLLLRR